MDLIAKFGARPDRLFHAGLDIFVDRQYRDKGLSLRTVIEPGLWFGVVASGEVQTYEPGWGQHDWMPSTAFCFWLDKATQSDHLVLESGTFASFFVRIRPEQVSHFFSPQELERLLVPRVFLANPDVVQRAMGLAWQAICCVRRGAARRFTLAAGAAQLIGEMVNGIMDSADPAYERIQSENFSAADIERTFRARDILIANLRKTPKIEELAREVGLNSKKLTQIFLEIFDETPYAFAKQRKFESAFAALQTGHENIAQIAARYGYKPAHFSTEFRRQFGVSPSSMLCRPR